jgi:hypothetical protein
MTICHSEIGVFGESLTIYLYFGVANPGQRIQTALVSFLHKSAHLDSVLTRLGACSHTWTEALESLGGWWLYDNLFVWEETTGQIL